MTDSGFIIINDGVNATVAHADSAVVYQGEKQTIDVLANDTDASGAGLQIIEVRESANATIIEKDGVVHYTPDFGFIGMDSFLYVIEDGDGTQSTGTVSVNVLRFSDINKNGENDFRECQCTNLTIEVGVEGTALGQSSWLSVFLFSLFGIFRMRQRTRLSPSNGVLR